MTVRKRRDTGRWVSDFYYNGERIVRTLKFARTKKEAEQAEAVIMNQVFQQAYGFEAKPDKLFEDFVVETFLPYSEANKRSFNRDISICRVLVKAFKNKTLRELSSPLIETFKQEFAAKPIIFENKDKTKRTEKRRTPAGVNYYLRVLSKILSMAVDAEILDNNPCRRVRKFKLDNQRTRVLSNDEEQKLMDALSENQLVKEIMIVALYTGLRRGEIFNLAWDDVDFERRVILVEKSKSGKKRVIPMNKTVLELFKNISRCGELVFPSPRTGRRLDTIRKGFTDAVMRAGIRNFRFHDLRHTAASRMAEAGTDAFTLMKILGHSTIQMTARYTHASDMAIRRALDKLDTKSVFGNELVTEIKTANVSSP